MAGTQLVRFEAMRAVVREPNPSMQTTGIRDFFLKRESEGSVCLLKCGRPGCLVGAFTSKMQS